jgi:hypothetical protein
MSQSRMSSLIEAVINTAIGFVISLVLTAVVFPAYGHAITFGQNLQITGIFTAASILRSYILRRCFNARIHGVAIRLARES